MRSHFTAAFTRLTELDALIVRIALIEAQQLVEQGLTPAAAATRACPGAWQTLQGEVLRRLDPAAHSHDTLPFPVSDAA